MLGISIDSLRRYCRNSSPPSTKALLDLHQAGQAIGVPVSINQILLGEIGYDDMCPSAWVPLLDDEGGVQLSEPWCEHWLAKVGVDPAEAALVEQKGDAMSPTVDDGDLVLIRRSPEYIIEGVYAIVLDGSLVVRRLQRLSAEDPERYIILSDNHSYAPVTKTLGEGLSILGRRAVGFHTAGERRMD